MLQTVAARATPAVGQSLDANGAVASRGSQVVAMGDQAKVMTSQAASITDQAASTGSKASANESEATLWDVMTPTSSAEVMARKSKANLIELRHGASALQQLRQWAATDVHGIPGFLFVVPVLGFVASILAIVATIALEQGQGSPGDDAVQGTRLKSSTYGWEAATGSYRPAPAPAHGDLVGPQKILKDFRSILTSDAATAGASKPAWPADSPEASAQDPFPGALGRHVLDIGTPDPRLHLPQVQVPCREPSDLRASELLGHFEPQAEALLPQPPSPALLSTALPAQGPPVVMIPQTTPPGTGVFVSSMAGTGTPQVVRVKRPLDGGRLGLKLTEFSLELTDYTDERARQFGFVLGDRILQVNGVQVTQEEDFLEKVQRAVALNQASGQPLEFVVLRPPAAPAPRVGDAAAAGGNAALAGGAAAAAGGGTTVVASAGGQEPATRAVAGSKLLGSWVYSDDSDDYPYQVSEGKGGQLRFEQRLPSGEDVSAFLDQQGDWHMGSLVLASGQPHGTIRLRYDTQKSAVVSQLLSRGSDAWGEEVVARRRLPETSGGAA